MHISDQHFITQWLLIGASLATISICIIEQIVEWIKKSRSKNGCNE